MEMSKEFKALVAHYNRVKAGFSPSDRREFMDQIEREQRREILKQQEESKKKASARKGKATTSKRVGGGRSAGVGSALGRTPKSLLKNKLMPNT